MVARRVTVRTETIALDAFLKWAGVTQTGGQAKALVQGGSVQVNGQVETRRGRKLVHGDRVEIPGQAAFIVVQEGR